MIGRRLVAASAACALLVGCAKKTPPPPEGLAGSPSGSAAASLPIAPPDAGAGAHNVTFDLLNNLDGCTLGHNGTLLDLGDPSARLGIRADEPRVDTIEREGATWARLRARQLALTFVEPGDTARTEDGGAPVFVAARVFALAARAATVFLNGKVVGSWQLARGETRVVVARGGSASLATGTNELLVRFSGAPRGSDEALAEVDWVHVGTGDPEASYAAPTRADATLQAALENVAKHAVALRAPGFVRCTTFFPSHGRVDAQLGLAGVGEADAEIRLHRDRLPPLVLARVHVSSRTPAWTSVAAPLGDLGREGTLAMLEVVSLSASRGARVLVADARVIAPDAPSLALPTARTPARNAVLVVLGSLGTRMLAPYGGAQAAPELAALAQTGVLFESHRATTSIASGALASMLSGVTAPTHGVVDADARLPRAITTVADAVRAAGVLTAFFSANPTTSAPFGFDRGWDTFVAQPPLGEVAATRVLDDAAHWIDEHRKGRFLVVVHARGGHPPWDATSDELKTLPPPGYAGPIDPKHAAELLSARSKRAATRLTDADKIRIAALTAHSIEAHDAALGRLVSALRAAGHEDDTAVVVTSDVAPNDASPAPFAEGEPTDESPLAVPLVVRIPGFDPPARRVRTPTASLDVARTLLRTLGLEPPATFEGVDLRRAALGEAIGRPLMASGSERYVMRWGGFVLFGARDRDARLCNTALEPACLTDVASTHPIALDALHRAALDERAATARKRPRESVSIDPATATALKAWGR